jgi:aryl-alcohol dehydrogenase-like predicted oxidoreductase
MTMKYRVLGGTGLNVSVVGLGTWQFGGEWGRQFSQAEVDAILDRAAECGLNLIDTAECYGDHLSESLIGDYLTRHDRSRWIVATKFGHQFHRFMDRTWHWSPREVQEQLEASLRALKTDVIDVYQFHSGSDLDFQQPELWSMLRQQKEAGKIRHLGVSISSKAGPFQAEAASSVGAGMVQVVYNRLERRAEQDFFPSAQRFGLGVLARVPLASGFLTGKFTGTEAFPSNDMRSTIERTAVDRWMRELEQIRATELPVGVPMGQWALAWCLKNPTVTSVIPGCKNPEQVEFNAKAADVL